MRVPSLSRLSRPAPAAPSRRPMSAFAGSAAVLLVAVSGGLAACGGGGGASMPSGEPVGSMPAASMPAASMPAASSMPIGATGAQPADANAIEAAWEARPDYVRHAHPRVAEAYRYALERPDVIQWMPCYCGCEGMGHRSNLDCFLLSRMAGGAVAFEEHASFCDICVETALLAKQRLAEGRALAEIRAEVDVTWGGAGVPGTDTALPQG